jgi:hypothetical protein
MKQPPSPRALQAAVASLLLAVPSPPSWAEMPELDYLLELPARQMVAFEIELPLEHAGVAAFEATWDTTRVLSFRIDDPDGATRLRRSGPPPLAFELHVGDDLDPLAGAWKLSIRGLPADQPASGRLSIRLPGPAPAPEAVPAPAPPELAEPPPAFLEPRTPPAGASLEVVQLFEATEELRSHVAEMRRSSRDRYGWQEPLLDYLARERDRAEPLDDTPFRALLERTVHATRSLEGLAYSDDPLIVGPPPEDAQRRRAWLMLRRERIRPVEADLDDLLHEVTRRDGRHGETPEWLPKLVTSLMACERHFEQRGRIGEKAAHGDIVAEQWDGLRIGAEALESLLELDAPD